MHKRETSRMQSLTLEVSQYLNQFVRCALWQRQTPAIDLIARQRVPAMGKVHPNLVGSAGLKFDIDVGKRGESFLNGKMRDGRLAIFLHTHSFPVYRMPGDGLANGPATREDAVADRKIVARDVALGQKTHERGVRLQGFCDQ